jgi:hypothetical protein
VVAAPETQDFSPVEATRNFGNFRLVLGTAMKLFRAPDVKHCLLEVAGVPPSAALVAVAVEATAETLKSAVSA